MKIPPDTWKRLEPLLADGLELEIPARTAWLDGLRASHPDLAPLLERMLATHDRVERAHELETVPRLAPPPPSRFTAGDRVGPFRLVRSLGRGGMGEVWLAAQADGRLEREVAVKLPTMLDAGDMRAERFGRERDILAKLVHPNIARLYDAGAGEDGQPYLAMEFVEGVAFDAYVKREGLGIPARLALFRQVLAAVADAHRHLVVHRDLKPANILIDGKGQVKLLDFGIAKLVENEGVPGAPDLTRIGGRVLTLRYAAPEQVAEGSITTATDIYALGVVLHELLTGASPYRAVREGKPLTDLVLVQEDIARPSSLAKGLDPDLDAIVLKSLRRDPAERYPTVEALDEDIRRHLEHRPVHARAGTWRYLVGRFVRRHRLPIAMAAAVMVTLAAGLVVAERERRIAVEERARAERHFASVRKLANTFIFQVHDEIDTLPGSLKAREVLVKTSLDYLDALTAEAGNDPGLRFELASAYKRIASIQGHPGAASLGDPKSAIANLEKAKALHESIAAARGRDLASVREHTNTRYMLARAYAVQADPRWQPEIARAVELSALAATLPGATTRDRARVSGAIAEQAHLTSILSGQTPEVEALVQQAIASLEALATEVPTDTSVRLNLASTYQRAAEILTGDKRTDASVKLANALRRKGLALFDALARELPNDQRVPSIRAENLIGLASGLSLAGETKEALAFAGEARRHLATLRTSDPKNADIAATSVQGLAITSLVARQAGELAMAERDAREAIALDAALPPEMRTTKEARSYLADARFALGAALFEAAKSAGPARRAALLREARPHLAASVDFIAAARRENLGAMPATEVKEREDALEACDEAIRRLSPA
ncbi:MAG: serine/threonine protein kinase [Betaproteobacteria bacterium]|nr:serine/threonine protein kinase [Betaproteobacteria bacterium]